MCIPKLPFRRVCKEILNKIGDFRIKPEALDALHMETEEFLIELFHYSSLCAENANRATIRSKDMKLAMKFLAPRRSYMKEEDHQTHG